MIISLSVCICDSIYLYYKLNYIFRLKIFIVHLPNRPVNTDPTRSGRKISNSVLRQINLRFDFFLFNFSSILKMFPFLLLKIIISLIRNYKSHKTNLHKFAVKIFEWHPSGFFQVPDLDVHKKSLSALVYHQLFIILLVRKIVLTFNS